MSTINQPIVGQNQLIPTAGMEFLIGDSNLMYHGDEVISLNPNLLTIDRMQLECYRRCLESYPTLLAIRSYWDPSQVQNGNIYHPLRLVSFVVEAGEFELLKTDHTGSEKLLTRKSTMDMAEIYTRIDKECYLLNGFELLKDVMKPLYSTSLFSEHQSEIYEILDSGENEVEIIQQLLQFRFPIKYQELVRKGDISDYISRKSLVRSIHVTTEMIDNYGADPTSPESIEFETAVREFDPNLDINEFIGKVSGMGADPLASRVIYNQYITAEGDDFFEESEWEVDPYVYYFGESDATITTPILSDNSTVHLEIRYTTNEDEDQQQIQVISRMINIRDSYIILDNLFILQITSESIVLYPKSDTIDEYYISSCKLIL